MQSANYTSHNICHALGVGAFMPAPDGALRLLLTPSFHAEVCVSFVARPMSIDVHVVAAQVQIWRQESPWPKPTPVHAASGEMAVPAFEDIVQAWRTALQPQVPSRTVILDGMRAHAAFRQNGRTDELHEAILSNSDVGRFVGTALSGAWTAVVDPHVRNALCDAGGYAGLDLPHQTTPPEKPTVRTLMLGIDDVAQPLLDALKQHHER